jgi:hypothetical protein
LSKNHQTGQKRATVNEMEREGVDEMEREGADERDTAPGPGEDWIWAPSRAPGAPEPEVATEPDNAPHGRDNAGLKEATGHAARVALGMTVLAAERFGPQADQTLALGVGLAQQTAGELRGIANRFVGPSVRAASRTLDWATRQTFLRANSGPLARRRAELRRLVELARERGQATMEAGRTEASTFLRASVDDGVTWAEEQAVPQVVDGLVPHLVESVVPQIVDGIVPHLVDTVVPQVIDGVMPEIRAKVLPVIIDDLTNDPRLRELVLEQSRGVVGEAAQQMRSATATADDRVEQAFRRLVRTESDKGDIAEASTGTEPSSTER